MQRSRGLLFFLGSVSTFGWTSCTGEKDAPLTVEQVCEKLQSFRGEAGKGPSEKPICIAEYRAMPSALRTCSDACVKTSTNAVMWEDCRDSCSGRTAPPFLTCSKIASAPGPFKACMAKHEALQADQPDAYTCWARCGRRAETDLETARCDERCKVP